MLTPDQSRRALAKDEWLWLLFVVMFYGAFVRQHIPAAWLKWVDLGVFVVLVVAGLVFIYLFGYGDHERLSEWWKSRLTCIACRDKIDHERTASEKIRRWLWRLP